VSRGTNRQRLFADLGRSLAHQVARLPPGTRSGWCMGAWVHGRRVPELPNITGRGDAMDGTSVLWIVLGAVVLLAAVVLIVMGTRRAKDRQLEDHRQQAYNHYQEALEAENRAEKQEAVAAEVDARSRKAQAEADEKAAEARRLAAGARERQGAAADARTESAEHRERAAELSPEHADKSGLADDSDEREDGQAPRHAAH
jgi:hypothetical protein